MLCPSERASDGNRLLKNSNTITRTSKSFKIRMPAHWCSGIYRVQPPRTTDLLPILQDRRHQSNDGTDGETRQCDAPQAVILAKTRSWKRPDPHRKAG